jgi:tetratricopeptide (TPR) repeat protein
MASERYDGLIAVLETFARGERPSSMVAGGYTLARLLTSERRTKAERVQAMDLSRMFRDEAAALLRGACYEALLEAPPGKSLLVRARNSDGEVDCGLEEGEARHALAIGRAGDHAEMQSARLLLRRSQPSILAERPKPVQLAVAALRLADESTARLYLAQALLQEGSVERSLEAAYQVVQRAVDPRTRAYAHVACGLARTRAGHLGGALEEYRLAMLAAPERIAPAFSSLALALRVGAAREAQESAWRLADACGSEEDIGEYLNVMQAGESSGFLGRGQVIPGDDAVRLRSMELPRIAERVRNAVLG